MGEPLEDTREGLVKRLMAVVAQQVSELEARSRDGLADAETQKSIGLTVKTLAELVGLHRRAGAGGEAAPDMAALRAELAARLKALRVAPLDVAAAGLEPAPSVRTGDGGRAVASVPAPRPMADQGRAGNDRSAASVPWAADEGRYGVSASLAQATAGRSEADAVLAAVVAAGRSTAGEIAGGRSSVHRTSVPHGDRGEFVGGRAGALACVVAQPGAGAPAGGGRAMALPNGQGANVAGAAARRAAGVTRRARAAGNRGRDGAGAGDGVASGAPAQVPSRAGAAAVLKGRPASFEATGVKRATRDAGRADGSGDRREAAAACDTRSCCHAGRPDSPAIAGADGEARAASIREVALANLAKANAARLAKREARLAAFEGGATLARAPGGEMLRRRVATEDDERAARIRDVRLANLAKANAVRLAKRTGVEAALEAGARLEVGRLAPRTGGEAASGGRCDGSSPTGLDPVGDAVSGRATGGASACTIEARGGADVALPDGIGRAAEGALARDDVAPTDVAVPGANAEAVAEVPADCFEVIDASGEGVRGAEVASAVRDGSTAARGGRDAAVEAAARAGIAVVRAAPGGMLLPRLSLAVGRTGPILKRLRVKNEGGA